MPKVSMYFLFVITMCWGAQLTHADALQKMQVCIGCHGTDISSASDIPNLAGQNAAYIFNQVQNFKDGSRDDFIMTAMVQAISDEDIKIIAAEYAKITPKKNTSADATLAAKGKMIFEDVCFACHGADGLGDDSVARLASQKSVYIIKQLQDFKNGKRKNDTMPDIVSEMGEDDMKAVAEYISTL